MGLGVMEIRKVPVKDLKPAKYNPRKDLQPGDPEFEKLKLAMWSRSCGTSAPEWSSAATSA